jgi:WhiB family redox-sensing transcriptional regulator
LVQAACQGRTELFFAPHAERADLRERRESEARLLCLACPLLRTCRAWAREHREYGFWGGESEEERAAAGYAVSLPTGRVARVIREIAAGVRSGPPPRELALPPERYSRTG